MRIMDKNILRKVNLLNWLHAEVKPALGCTEPVAIAFAAATAAQRVEGNLLHMFGNISKNLFKNANGVLLPGTKKRGVTIAAALGFISGNADLGLEVLRDVLPEDIQQAETLIAENKIKITTIDSEELIYVDLTVITESAQCRVVIKGAHTHITQISVNNIETFRAPELCPEGSASQLKPFTVNEAVIFIKSVPVADIAFMTAAIDLNSALSAEGQKRPYGLNVSGTLCQAIADGMSKQCLLNQIAIDAAAASDARMGGAPLPAMSNFGSGNQGIVATMPVVTLARHLVSSSETTLRAVTLSHLVAISIHARYARLSALCAASTAAMGAAAGMAWLFTQDETVIACAIKNMISDISGMVCDGASGTCAMKVSTAATSAIKSVLMATNGISAGSYDGIVDDELEQSINHLCQLTEIAMKQTDRQIIQIISDKASAESAN